MEEKQDEICKRTFNYIGHQSFGCGNFLLDNMSMMFIPAGVGIIRYREQLMQVGVPYLVINVLSTFIVFVVTGWAAQWMMERGGKKQ